MANNLCTDCPRCSGAGKCTNPLHAGRCICGEAYQLHESHLRPMCERCRHCAWCHSQESINRMRSLEVANA